MNMNNAPKGSAQEGMEGFAEKQIKIQAEERTAKKKAESVIQKNNAENISKLSKKTKSDRENLLKKIELEDEIRSDSEDIFKGILPPEESVVSREEIKEATLPKETNEQPNEQPPAPLIKRPVGRPKKEPVVSMEDVEEASPTPKITNEQPAPFRKGRGEPRKTSEEETITDKEYLTEAEETGKKVAEMVKIRKAREAAEKSNDEKEGDNNILNEYFNLKKESEASEKKRDKILKTIKENIDEDSKKKLRDDLINADTEVKSYGLKTNELISKMSPENKARIEAEKQFDVEAKNMLTALKEEGLVEEEKELAKKATELEKRGEKIEKRRIEKEKKDKKNKEIRQQLESAYNPSDTELFLENKIGETEELIEQNDNLEKDFEKLFKKFEEMNYTSFFNWERMKYIMMGDQDADKEKLMGMIETMEINDRQIKKKNDDLAVGINALKKELGANASLEKKELLINRAENKFRDYLDNRQAKIKEMLDKMK